MFASISKFRSGGKNVMENLQMIANILGYQMVKILLKWPTKGLDITWNVLSINFWPWVYIYVGRHQLKNLCIECHFNKPAFRKK